MQVRMVWLTAMIVLGSSGFVALSLGLGQDRPGTPPAAPAKGPAAGKRAGPDPARLNFLQRQLLASAQRGADWLQRANRADGRFGHVAAPALRTRVENDHYLRQAGAAAALARAARFLEDERCCAVATQSVLTLLLATAPDDARNPQVRRTTVAPGAVNPLAAAGLLVLAVHELPAPADDLLNQADQLCNYIRRQQLADGSLTTADNPSGVKPTADDSPAGDGPAAEALYGLMRSQQRRPAPWKVEAVRKALAYYHPRWQARKSLAAVPRFTAAYAEAYLLSGEQAFAEAVYEMNDWLCSLQYQQLDPARPLWVGGFMSWADGKALPLAPEVNAAAFAEALADACRVARRAGDVRRDQRYRDALERCLQFVTTLQYTEGNTQHFADWYRPQLVGAFYLSHQDGSLRLDYTQHAVCALIHYLSHVAEAR